MDDQPALVLGVEDVPPPLPAREGAGIAHLPARLRIARGAVEDDFHLVTGDRLRSAAALVHEGEDPRRRRERPVTEELDLGEGRGKRLEDGRPVAGDGAEARARACPLALSLHLGLVFGLGLRRDGEATVLENLLGEVDGEAVGVVEREEDPARHAPPVPVPGSHRPGRPALDLGLDPLEPAIEGLGEALLLQPAELAHPPPLLAELRVHVAHPVGHGARDLPQERLGEPEHPPVAHRPPHDPPEHVASPLVGGADLIRDEERGGPRVVGDDAHGDVVGLARPVRLPAAALDVGDQRAEQVGVEVRALPLDDGGDALEPHAGVDRGPRQGVEPSRCVPVELHEDQVPDLEPAVALALGPETPPPGRLLGAGEIVALVVVDLRAGSAGSLVPHRPEVVLLAETEDAIVGQTGDRLPEAEGFVVVGVDGRPEARRGEPQVPRQETPRVGDGIGFEVVPE